MASSLKNNRKSNRVAGNYKISGRRRRNGFYGAPELHSTAAAIVSSSSSLMGRQHAIVAPPRRR